MVEVVSPIEDLRAVVVFVAHQHPAAVPLRRGGSRGAGVVELLRHGALVEEGEARAPKGVEEGRRNAVVGDVEGAPFAAGSPDGFPGRVAVIRVEPGEVDGGNIGAGIGLVVVDGSVLRGLDVFGWDPG